MALTLVAAENLAEFDAVYINADGKMALADADSATTMPAITLAKAAIAADAPGEFYQLGDEITNAAWSWSLDKTAAHRGMVYVSTTAGGLTQTIPSGSGDQVQIAGIATAATKMLLYPQLLIGEVA